MKNGKSVSEKGKNMKIRNMIIDSEVITSDDLDFLLTQMPLASTLIDKEDTDENVIAFIDEIQNHSINFLGDGNVASEEAKRFDDIVYELSGL